MRIRFVLLFLLAAAVFCAAAKTIGDTDPQAIGPTEQMIAALKASLIQNFGDQALSMKNPVGSEYCIACHAAFDPEIEEWHETLHSHFIRKPMGMWSLVPGKGIMADYDHNGVDDFKQGLDFNTISSAMDATKPNAPILSYDAAADKYYIQLGPGGLKVQVVGTLGGQSATNGQRFICRIPVSDGETGWSSAVYFGPVAWSGTAFSSNSSAWYNGSTPKYAPGVTRAQLGDATNGLQAQNYMKNCIGCHMTGVRQAWVSAAGEYVANPFPATLVPNDSPNYPDLDGDSIPDMLNIGCESCHGPGSLHILAGGDPAAIVNPKDITNNKDRSNVCLQCHVQTGSAPTKKWGWTYDETNNAGFFVSRPMPNLANFQSSKAVKWPDGVNYVTARIDSYMSSAHYMGSHGIACNNCHNSHAETTNPAQVRDLISSHGVSDIPAHVENDSFCLSCHNAPYFLDGITAAQIKDWDNNFDAIRNAVEAHTNHPYGADRIMGLSNCIGCHMAPNQGHTFWPARPEDTIAYAGVTTGTATGNVNSCASSCHRGNVRIWQDVQVIPDWTNNKYGTATEVALAGHLVEYFGPEGAWWVTTPHSAKMEKAHE